MSEISNNPEPEEEKEPSSSPSQEEPPRVPALVGRRTALKTFIASAVGTGITGSIVGAAGEVAINAMEHTTEEELQDITDAWESIGVEKRGATHLGVTFRPSQAEWYGLDPKKALERICNLPIDVVRIGYEWNNIEQPDGSFDFSNIDSFCKQIQDAGKKVIITIGMKAPGYPEYYIPERYNQYIPQKHGAIEDKTQLSTALFRFTKACATHLHELQQKNMISLSGVQIENEPIDPAGPEQWTIAIELLLQELQIIRNILPNTQLIITGLLHPTFLDLLKRFLQGDSFDTLQKIPHISIGVDVYPKIPVKRVSERYTEYEDTQNALWGDTRLNDLASITHKSVTEFEGEPWEIEAQSRWPKGKAPASCKPEDIITRFNSCITHGGTWENICLWGIEYALSREEQGDPQWWQAWERVCNES